MPARSERIYICPRESGQPGWIMDFPVWWSRDRFFAKFGDFDRPGSRWFDTKNPWYVDYAMLLTMGEASAWNKDCLLAFTQDPHSQNPTIAQAMQQLAERLQQASWVIVESYEWESGLD